MMLLIRSLAFLGLFISTAARAGEPPFQGYFKSQAMGMEIVLELTVSGSTVTGTYAIPVLEQQPYTVQGEISGETLSGTMTDPSMGMSHPFRAEMIEADRMLVIEMRKRLVRSGFAETPREFRRSAKSATAAGSPATSGGATTGAPASAGSSEWDSRLRGARLTYMWSHYSGGSSGQYVGGSETIRIDLCAAGHFKYQGSSVFGGSSAGGGVSALSHGSGGGQGAWSVVSVGGQDTLRLQAHGGQVRDYRLEFSEGKTLLDGERFFRTYADDSDPNHRPSCP